MKPRPAECFDAVLRAMDADRTITMKEALRRLNHACGYSAFKEWVRTNPAQKAQIDALRSPPAAETYFDAIAALIRGGMTVKEACSSRPEYPKADTFLAWLRHRPDLYAGLKPAMDASNAARAARQPKPWLGYRKHSPEVLDCALATIRASDVSDLRTVLVPPLPGYGTLQAYAARDPEFARRFRDAIDARPNPNRWRPEDFKRALDAIRDNPNKTVLATLEGFDGPRYATVQHRAANDPEFAAQLDAVLSKRFADKGHRRKGIRVPPEAYARAIAALRAGGYRSATERLRNDPALPTLGGLQAYAKRNAEALAQYQAIMGARRPKAAPKPVYGEYQLRRLLSRNELFRNARASLPGAYDDQRQDQIQDAVLHMLECGERASSKQIIGKFCARNLSRGCDSLDEEVFDGEVGNRRGDLFTTNEVTAW